MSYKLYWFGTEFQDYYVSGAITNKFNIQEQNLVLTQLLQEEKDIIIIFEEKDNMMIIKGFEEFKEDTFNEDSIGYVLDDGLVELIQNNLEESNLSIYVAILGLQYFQFDTLEEVILLDEADLEEMTPVEREEIEQIRSIFMEMPEEEREKFLEQELFYYEKEELTHWIEHHQ